MNVYTYVVNHGDECPRIKAGTVINGGTLQGVMFADALMSLEALEKFIDNIRYMVKDGSRIACEIDDFMQQQNTTLVGTLQRTARRMGETHRKTIQK